MIPELSPASPIKHVQAKDVSSHIDMNLGISQPVLTDQLYTSTLTPEFSEVGRIGESTLFAREDELGSANFRNVLELKAESVTNSQGESIVVATCDADVTGFPDSLRLLSIELRSADIFWTTFYNAVAEFTYEASGNLEQSDWDGSYELIIDSASPTSRGDDGPVFSLKPPFLPAHFIAFEVSTHPSHNPEGSPHISIGAGSNSFQDFELIREEGKADQVNLTVATNIFRDKQKMIDDTKKFFAHFKSEVAKESLPPIIDKIQKDPKHAI